MSTCGHGNDQLCGFRGHGRVSGSAGVGQAREGWGSESGRKRGYWRVAKRLRGGFGRLRDGSRAAGVGRKALGTAMGGEEGFGFFFLSEERRRVHRRFDVPWGGRSPCSSVEDECWALISAAVHRKRRGGTPPPLDPPPPLPMFEADSQNLLRRLRCQEDLRFTNFGPSSAGTTGGPWEEGGGGAAKKQRPDATCEGKNPAKKQQPDGMSHGGQPTLPTHPPLLIHPCGAPPPPPFRPSLPPF